MGDAPVVGASVGLVGASVSGGPVVGAALAGGSVTPGDVGAFVGRDTDDGNVTEPAPSEPPHAPSTTMTAAARTMNSLGDRRIASSLPLAVTATDPRSTSPQVTGLAVVRSEELGLACVGVVGLDLGDEVLALVAHVVHLASTPAAA